MRFPYQYIPHPDAGRGHCLVCGDDASPMMANLVDPVSGECRVTIYQKHQHTSAKFCHWHQSNMIPNLYISLKRKLFTHDIGVIYSNVTFLLPTTNTCSYFGTRQLSFVTMSKYQFFLIKVGGFRLDVTCVNQRQHGSYGASPWKYKHITGLILGFRPANERWRYFVTTSLIGWVQA